MKRCEAGAFAEAFWKVLERGRPGFTEQGREREVRIEREVSGFEALERAR